MTVKKGLRQLPYLEMSSLAKEVKIALSTAVDADFIANALATLPSDEVEESLKQDNEMLALFFSRKRNINIIPQSGIKAWKITCQGGPYIYTNNLREGIMQFLESLAALKALEK